jgi:uncharacterized GH25 family protein
MSKTSPFVALFITMWLLPLGAHDFWMEPSAFAPPAGSVVSVRLLVGEQFTGEPVARMSNRIEQFIVAGPDGSRPVIGRDGGEPAGLFRTDRPGTYVVGYRSRPSGIQLDGPAFEKYLREEGLEAVSASRAARGQTAEPGREHFSRSAKALVYAAPDASGDYDRRLGLTLEFVPERDPRLLAGQPLPVQLLYEGRPLPDALVVAMSRPAGPPIRVRTDRQGRVRLPVTEGVWLLKAVHMVPATGEGADWESIWASLTFAVPPR